MIDLVLQYGAYVGGSSDDRAHAIAVDVAGSAYVAGETWPVAFPRSFNFSSATGNQDAFVVKLNAAGTSILWATYFGGRARDSARGVALVASENLYVAGVTGSTDFPTTAGAHRYSAAGQEDVFVVKLNASGSGLVYSTLIGAAGSDTATGIAMDGAGNAYVSGYANSLGFPVTAPRRRVRRRSSGRFAAEVERERLRAGVCHVSGRTGQRYREGNRRGRGRLRLSRRLHGFLQFTREERAARCPCGAWRWICRETGAGGRFPELCHVSRRRAARYGVRGCGGCLRERLCDGFDLLAGLPGDGRAHSRR